MSGASAPVPLPASVDYNAAERLWWEQMAQASDDDVAWEEWAKDCYKDQPGSAPKP